MSGNVAFLEQFISQKGVKVMLLNFAYQNLKILSLNTVF